MSEAKQQPSSGIMAMTVHGLKYHLHACIL